MKQKQSIKIIQLSDTHLSKDNSTLFDINTNKAFKKIMENIQSELTDTDAIFLTGDISQDESIESYELIANSLKIFTNDIFWIPGNHDSLTNMHLVFDKIHNFRREKTLVTPVWDFIFLDTKKEGKESGVLSNNELQMLEQELQRDRKKPIALVMHHHPIEVKTPLIDNFILENKEEFFDIVQGKINLIICGHVHNDYSFQYSTIHIEASPATCFQFKKGASNLLIENYIGYKIYYFSSEHYVIDTKVWKN